MAIITHTIYLTSKSQAIEANTYPENGGPSSKYQYIDANKDGKIDYVILAGEGKQPRALFTQQYHNLAPQVFRDFSMKNKAVVKDSPNVQAQFEKTVSSANETYEELVTALNENRVKPSGTGPTTFDVCDARGQALFEIRLEEYPKPNGQLEIKEFTIQRRYQNDNGETIRETIFVKDPTLVNPLEAKFDRLLHPEKYREPTSQNHHHIGQRQPHGALQSSKHVANR